MERIVSVSVREEKLLTNAMNQVIKYANPSSSDLNATLTAKKLSPLQQVLPAIFEAERCAAKVS